MVSSLVCKDLGNCYSILTTNKKVTKLKNQLLFLDFRRIEVIGQTAATKIRIRPVDTENYNILEQKLPEEPVMG